MVETLELIGLEPMVMSMPYSKPDTRSKKSAEASWTMETIETAPAKQEERQAEPVHEKEPLGPRPLHPAHRG
ncbi:MAG: hypothetical protein MZV70_68750 [Desulfobacterales bacterium]|nr:hypothetical protein [Desulfobacterales bacterium]